MASALALKEQGNRAFSEGDYTEAESLYTRAIQHDPTNPAFFTNRAFTRVKLEAWEGCLADSLKAIDLCPPDDKPSTIKMKAYYYLTQAQLGMRRPGEALCSALRAYEISIAMASPKAQQMSALVLRAKRDKWEAAEGERLRARSQLLREVEAALRAARDRADAELDDRVAWAQARGCDNLQPPDAAGAEDAEVADERTAIQRHWEAQVRGVRNAFALSDPAELGRREVPDHLIDSITFAVMHDPVVTKHGHSYERATIEAHLRISETDPLTRAPLTVHDLRPNLALKEAAAKFLEENGWAVDW